MGDDGRTKQELAVAGSQKAASQKGRSEAIEMEAAKESPKPAKQGCKKVETEIRVAGLGGSKELNSVLTNDRQWHVETCDVLDGLRSLPDGCVQCCVTSPPYYALRDYGIDGQIGLEETPDAYVAKMVEVFSEVRRVLRDDGTCWLNIGDSYAGSGPSGASYQSETTKRRAAEGGKDGAFRVSKTLESRGLTYAEKKPVAPAGYKPKDLMGIPWQLAFALRADGWYLRQDIIWSKPNGMPESVTDRCTKSHEHIFLLTKSERYFYDRMAIAEPVKPVSIARAGRGVADDNKHTNGAPGQIPHGLHAPRSAVKFGGTKHTEAGQTRLASGNEYECDANSTANRRSVWTIPVGGFREAHFATFPLAIPETCLKAGTSLKGCCSVCGTPWERTTESERVPTRPGDGSKVHGANSRANKSRDPAHASEYEGKKSATEAGNRDPERHVTRTTTTGWQAGCDCNASIVPCLAMDIFNGAGTTGLVAVKGLGLRYVGFELNPDYADMARRRIERGFEPPAPKIQPCAGQSTLF